MNSSEKDCRATAEISKENGAFAVFRGSRALGRSPAGVGCESPSNAPGHRVKKNSSLCRSHPSAPRRRARNPRGGRENHHAPSRALHRPRFATGIRQASRGSTPLLPKSPSPGFRNPCQSSRRRGRVHGARAGGPQERPRGIVELGWAAGRRAADALPPLKPGWVFATSPCAARRTGATPQRATSQAPRNVSRFQTV